MSDLTNISENNDNLRYDELIGICIYIKKVHIFSRKYKYLQLGTIIYYIAV